MPEAEIDRRKLLRPRQSMVQSGLAQDALAPLDSISAGNAIQRAHDPRAPLSGADLLSLQSTIGNRSVQRLLAQRGSPAGSLARDLPQFSPPQVTPVGARPSAPRLMRSIHPAGKSRIQRAENWQDFKRYSQGIWGQGGAYRNENSQALNFIDPRRPYRKHAQKGGKWNKFKGIMSGGGRLLASPFAAAFGVGSLVGRGLQTVGAGGYYGLKALGGAGVSGATALGRGAYHLGSRAGNSIKDAYNKDRNPHGYNRERLPTSGKTGLELGKPGLTLGLSGGTLGGAEAGSTGAGFPAGAGLMNVLAAGDAALTWYNGSKRYDEARVNNDRAGMTLGTRKANQGKWGLAGGVAGVTQNALNLGVALKTGSQGLMSIHDVMGKAHYVSSGLGMAGAAAGIAGGALMAGQGIWKSMKGISKWRKLSKSAPMLTTEGDRWKAHIKDRQKTKVGLNALKTIGGALGIAAGALVIASNPVGWALGVAAAAVGGGLMAYKIYTKWKKSRRKQKAKAGVRQEMEEERQQQAQPNGVGMDGGGPDNGGGEQEHDEAGMHDADPTRLNQAKRKQAAELGNRVAQKVSKSGKVAGEIRGALPARRNQMYPVLMDSLERKEFTPDFLRKNNVKNYPFPRPVLKAHDALVMMSVLNLTAEQVESESGQELVEKKLSATDSL